jgi:N-acetylmuramoyl-L-alanine amidase
MTILGAVQGRTRAAVIAGGLVVLAIGILLGVRSQKAADAESGSVLVGEARKGGLTIELPQALKDIKVSEARVPGRPIVLLDPGHGGRDPGATGVSGTVREKDLTLTLARELRDLLVDRGRVRVALTRDNDRYLTLEQRAAIARRLGAAMFISLHVDSAPNPLARGVTVYSLSDVASSAEAARFAQAENRVDGALSSEADGSVRALLSDLALRDQMEDSAAFASRLVRRAAGPVQLRPRPHQFADFHVLRRAETPAILLEGGYISNTEDEAMLVTAEGRAPLVRALAQAIEADAASRRSR